MEVCGRAGWVTGEIWAIGIIELLLDRWKGLREAKIQEFGFENIV